jgi:hypothetical protein
MNTPVKALFATSVLLEREDADGSTTISHSLHWATADTHEEAIAEAIQAAKRLKPALDVTDVICGNTVTGTVKRVAFSDNESGKAY